MRARDVTGTLGRVLHAVAFWALAGAATAAVGATALSAAGVIPWLDLPAEAGGAPLPWAGPALQAGVAFLLCLLLAFLPASGRVLALERSHRSFRMSMQDVSAAYHAAHMADRSGAFTLSSEFDQVRERIEYLRDHPDLKLLEADVITLAAQMSQQSHRLAALYSDERVGRARDFLRQRQTEAADQGRRIAEALATCGEIRRWTEAVEAEEGAVAGRLRELEEELGRALVPLGYVLDPAAEGGVRRAEGNVVTLAAAG